jgi:hypothetical protein
MGGVEHGDDFIEDDDEEEEEDDDDDDEKAEKILYNDSSIDYFAKIVLGEMKMIKKKGC